MLAAPLGLAGCYEPALADCTITCSAPDQCVGGQVCLDGLCAAPNVVRCNEGQPVTIDASLVTTDAKPTSPDALDLCPQGCTNGTCVDGVCTIDCSAPDSCPGDIMCPANLPCRVVCGDSSCDKKINCMHAASCDVECSGDFSCSDEIQCPPGRACEVTCSGASSCGKRTRCKDACACDVTCSGVDACHDPAECPAGTCRIGNGCSSQLAGCNTCS